MIIMQIPIAATLSMSHIILICLAVLLLFGGKKIPELMRGLGKAIREFQDAKDGFNKDLESLMKPPVSSSNEEQGAAQDNQDKNQNQKVS